MFQSRIFFLKFKVSMYSVFKLLTRVVFELWIIINHPVFLKTEPLALRITHKGLLKMIGENLVKICL